MFKNAIGIIFLTSIFIGCQKDEDETFKIQNKNMLLYYKGQMDIVAVSDHPITYKSDNEFHAKVSENGIVEAQQLGETTIKVESNGIEKYVGVEVITKFTIFYRIPLTDWNLTRDDIISFHGEPDYSTYDAIGYEDSSTNSYMFAYFFDDNGDFDFPATYLEKSFNVNEYYNFLDERYLFIEERNGVMAYINDLSPLDASVFVGVDGSNSDYYITIFSNPENFKSTNNNLSRVKKFILK